MKNYLIRRRFDAGKLPGENNIIWVYLKSVTSQANQPPTIEYLSGIRIPEGVRTFETYHEAVSMVAKNLDDRWEVVNAYDVLVETLKELAEARA